MFFGRFSPYTRSTSVTHNPVTAVHQVRKSSSSQSYSNVSPQLDVPNTARNALFAVALNGLNALVHGALSSDSIPTKERYELLKLAVRENMKVIRDENGKNP